MQFRFRVPDFVDLRLSARAKIQGVSMKSRCHAVPPALFSCLTILVATLVITTGAVAQDKPTVESLN